MKEKPKTCEFCKWLENLPFSDEFLCGNDYSSYGGCECSLRDSCEAFERKDGDE